MIAGATSVQEMSLETCSHSDIYIILLAQRHSILSLKLGLNLVSSFTTL